MFLARISLSGCTYAAAALLATPLCAQDCDAVAASSLIDDMSPAARRLRPVGTPVIGHPYHLALEAGPADGLGFVMAGTEVSVGLFEATLHVGPPLFAIQAFSLDAEGAVEPLFELAAVPPSLCRVRVVFQAVVEDVTSLFGASLSNAMRVTFGTERLPQFGVPTFEVGEHPETLAIADVNRDGLLDIVTESSGDAVGVALGEGELAFSSPVVYSLGPLQEDPRHVALADLDLDGYPEIATANYSSKNVTTFRNLRDGSFGPAVPHATGDNPNHVSAGDLDGDGAADLVTADVGSGTWSLLRNQGAGTFFSAVSTPTSVLAPWGAVLADLNADGSLDVLVHATGVTHLELFAGKGDGTFESGSPIDVSGSTLDLAIEDLDLDGIDDLVLAHGTGGFSTLRGLGGGTFAEGVVYPNLDEPGQFPSGTRSVCVADVDDDGLPDVFARVTDSDRIAVYRGLGGGLLGVPETYASANHTAFQVADLDDDGALDVACVGFDQSRGWIHRGRQNGRLSAVRTVSIVGRPEWVDTTDLDGDGRRDLVAVCANGTQVAIARGIGGAQFAAAEFLDLGAAPNAGLFGDWNGDGAPDLAVADFNPAAWHLLANDGQGQLALIASTPTSSVNLRGMAGGDFDGDGNADLALGGSGVEVFLGDGAFGFSEPLEFPGATSVLSSADMDGDGLLDLLSNRGTSDSVGILYGEGDGTFVEGGHLQEAGDYVTSLTLGDFDADGFLDVVTNVREEGTIAFLRGSPVVGLQFAKHYPTVHKPVAVEAADLNGDGKLDVAVANASGQQFTYSKCLSILEGDGRGSFSAPRSFLTGGGGPDWLAIDDLDDDGVQDIVVATTTTEFPGFGGALAVLPSLLVDD